MNGAFNYTFKSVCGIPRKWNWKLEIGARVYDPVYWFFVWLCGPLSVIDGAVNFFTLTIIRPNFQSYLSIWLIDNWERFSKTKFPSKDTL